MQQRSLKLAERIVEMLKDEEFIAAHDSLKLAAILLPKKPIAKLPELEGL